MYPYAKRYPLGLGRRKARLGKVAHGGNPAQRDSVASRAALMRQCVLRTPEGFRLRDDELGDSPAPHFSARERARRDYFEAADNDLEVYPGDPFTVVGSVSYKF